jgi:poly(A) polymerase
VSSVSSPELERIRASVPLEDAWLVGGSVRDLLLGRAIVDVDLLVDSDPAAAARRLARAASGSPFPLSERHGAWRIVSADGTIDVARMRGSVEEDLGLRDFTVNAMAIRLDDERLADPFGGRADLERRLLRTVSDGSFRDDPLRLLRLVRLARELDFAIDGPTEEVARRDAPLASQPAGERIYAEMRRLLAGADPAGGIRLLERTGALAAVLPELAQTRGVEQNPYHHLDVFEHTLHVLDAAADVAAHPGHYLAPHGEVVERALGQPLADDLLRRDALRLAALFHDIAKPHTRVLLPDGRAGFPGHDRDGARIAARILGRWHSAAAVVRYCETLVREHLTLGFLTRRRPLDRRAAHRYGRATAPWTLDSIVLSLADRLVTRGRWSKQRHLRVHAETAAELIGLHLELEADPPPPLLRGDEIARATGVRGPRIGELVQALAEEQAAGTVTTRDEALAFLETR